MRIVSLKVRSGRFPIDRLLLRSAVIVLASRLTACSNARTDLPPPKSAGPATLVILNARIWTGTEGIQADSIARPTAVAVSGDRIVAVGSDAQVQSWVGRGTQSIDAHGRRLIPGITDSHTHLIGGGFQLARLNLRDAANREGFISAIAEEAKNKKSGQWILGGRWSVESWPDPQPPTRHWLDPVTEDIPLFLSRMDGHQALVNTAALKLAGIDAAGPSDPEGGEIERDPKTREPTGILKESAMGLVSRFIPDPSREEQDEALRRAMRHANSFGVTSVHDMCGWDDIDTFGRAERRGELSVRITAYASVGDWKSYAGRAPGGHLPDQPATYMDRITAMGPGNDWLRVAGVKGYIDGSLGSRTAYMREPYADATPAMPYPRGQLTAIGNPPESFQELVATADARGLQVAVHAIGDEGNHLLLDAYEYARKKNGAGGRRHRDEHTQHLLVSDIPRFAALGVVASMQPYHKADDGRYAEKALGKERLKGSYAFRQLVDAGALLIFGSDWPVVTIDPFAGIDSAVNARTLEGKAWLAEHSLAVEEALRAYTVMPPRAIGRDHRLGTIVVGKYADMVLLSDDPLTMPKDRIAAAKADVTIVGGRVAFTRSR